MNDSTKGEDLSARFAAVKQQYDTNLYSDLKDQEFPLWALLTIHYRSKLERWDERLQSFEALVNWLAPVVYTPKGVNCYPLTIFVPHSLGEMEYYLDRTERRDRSKDKITEQDIVECTLLDVLPKMNPARKIPKPYQDHCIPKNDVYECVQVKRN